MSSTTLQVQLQTAPRPPPPEPEALSAARKRLRVLPDGAQDCATCRNMQGCWSAHKKSKSKSLAPEAIVSNLLVCRLQRGIDREKTTKLLLSLLRPKLQKTANWVSKRTGTSSVDIVRELESEAIESLLCRYVVGELAPPLVWLFNFKHGGIRHWAHRAVTVADNHQKHIISYDSGTFTHYDNFERRIAKLNRATYNGNYSVSLDTIATTMPVMPDDDVYAEYCAQALLALDDGKTLTATEYRVLAFCLRNNSGTVRATDWLHRHLASVMGIPRKDVSRLYAIAVRKIIDAVGLRESFLRSLQITPPKNRRRARAKPLSVDETVDAVRVLRSAGERATILDLAWALDVTDVTVHHLRRRYAGLSPEEVRTQLEQSKSRNENRGAAQREQ